MLIHKLVPKIVILKHWSVWKIHFILVDPNNQWTYIDLFVLFIMSTVHAASPLASHIQCKRQMSESRQNLEEEEIAKETACFIEWKAPLGFEPAMDLLFTRQVLWPAKLQPPSVMSELPDYISFSSDCNNEAVQKVHDDLLFTSHVCVLNNFRLIVYCSRVPVDWHQRESQRGNVIHQGDTAQNLAEIQAVQECTHWGRYSHELANMSKSC